MFISVQSKRSFLALLGGVNHFCSSIQSKVMAEKKEVFTTYRTL